jgi:hypothetical protein
VTIEYLPQPFIQIDSPGQGTSKDEAGVTLDRLGQVVREPSATSSEEAG